MHTINPDRASADMASKVLRHVERVKDATPAAELAAEFGELKGRFWVLVPSDSHVGRWYEVRVRFHEGYVEAGHYGHACEAAEAGKACWHLYAATACIAGLFYDGKIPVAAVPVRSTPLEQPGTAARDDAEQGRWERRQVDDGFWG